MHHARCPICRQRLDVVTWRPFCSERCRRIDLGRWPDGTYHIPGRPEDPFPAVRSEWVEETQ